MFVVLTGIDFLASPEEINFDVAFVILMHGLLVYFVGILVIYWVLDLIVLPLYRKSRSGKKVDPGGDS